jgi:lipoate synthase
MTVLSADDPPSGAPPAPAREKKPDWLKVRAPGGETYARLKQTLRSLDLYTVCEEARCPNVGECWTAGTATIMLLGHTCTRGCRFCAVTTGNPRGAYDPREPVHVARAIAELGLKYVVLTMVDRDDLIDGGAEQVARTVDGLRERCPELLVETLVGDFRGRLGDVDTVLRSAPAVFAHNVEVTRRLTPLIRDARCDYDLSLRVLKHAKERAPDRFVKSSIMLGLGESTDHPLRETLPPTRGSACRGRRYRDARPVPPADAQARQSRSLRHAGGVCGLRTTRAGARLCIRRLGSSRALELSRCRGLRRRPPLACRDEREPGTSGLDATPTSRCARGRALEPECARAASRHGWLTRVESARIFRRIFRTETVLPREPRSGVAWGTLAAIGGATPSCPRMTRT